MEEATDPLTRPQGSFSAVLKEIEAAGHDPIAISVLTSRFRTCPAGWLSPYLLAKQGLLLGREADVMTLQSEARLRTLGKLPRIPQEANCG